MNDRFKFRMWHEKKSEMIELGICPQCNKCSPHKPVNLEECNIMQCTGLKDKNGTLIYEGDIVKFGEEIYKVAYRTEWACFVIQSSTSSTNTQTINTVETPACFMEIIGNIYENPELLKGEKNVHKR